MGKVKYIDGRYQCGNIDIRPTRYVKTMTLVGSYRVSYKIILSQILNARCIIRRSVKIFSDPFSNLGHCWIHGYSILDEYYYNKKYDYYRQGSNNSNNWLLSDWFTPR